MTMAHIRRVNRATAVESAINIRMSLLLPGRGMCI